MRFAQIRGQDGQALILIVLTLPLLLAVAALVVDGGNMFARRRSV